MPQFFLVVLIIFCTVTFRAGDSLKKPIFFFQLSFQRSTSFHTTCSLPLLSFLVRDWLSHFLTLTLQKWLWHQFQSMLGLLIQTTQHPLAACIRFSFMNIVHHRLRHGSFKYITTRQLSFTRFWSYPRQRNLAFWHLRFSVTTNSLVPWECWKEVVVILLETMFMKKYLKSLRY